MKETYIGGGFKPPRRGDRHAPPPILGGDSSPSQRRRETPHFSEGSVIYKNGTIEGGVKIKKKP